jgi:membrane-associated phospholipid phosphatase
MKRLAAFVLACLLPLAAYGQDATGPATHAETSFASLFTQLPRAFASFGDRPSLIILGVGGAASLAISTQDEELAKGAPHDGAIDAIFDGGGTAGDGFVQVGAALGTWVIGRAIDSPRTALVGADLVRAQIVNGVVTTGIKLAVNRTRPDGGSHSFPSGHTSSMFATATVLARHFGWKVGVPSMAGATYVAISRQTENHHWASDLTFGAAIGIVAGRGVTIGHGRRQLALSPAAYPGGAGLSVTLPNLQ